MTGLKEENLQLREDIKRIKQESDKKKVEKLQKEVEQLKGENHFLTITRKNLLEDVNKLQAAIAVVLDASDGIDIEVSMNLKKKKRKESDGAAAAAAAEKPSKRVRKIEIAKPAAITHGEMVLELKALYKKYVKKAARGQCADKINWLCDHIEAHGGAAEVDKLHIPPEWR